VVLARCTACEHRDGNKPITVFIAWRDANFERHGVKTNLCASCFVSRIAPLDVERDPTERLTCPACHIDTENDYDAVYCNSFIPGYGRRDVEAPFCNACAAQFRIWAQASGMTLEDRGRAEDSPSSKVSPEEVLASLGIQVRGAA